MYEYLKIIHVISASMLIGTSLSTTLYIWLGQKQTKTVLVDAASQGLLCSAIFTGLSAVALAITGFMMVGLKAYSMSSLWLVGSILGYFVIGTFWFSAFFLQLHCRDLVKKAATNNTALPQNYAKHYLTWKILSIMTLVTMTTVFFLMTGFRHHIS